ncbi:AraC family transcriptional regulator [Aeromicrobium ginsengisoli]|uniref:Helix-turn-helix transcriptional regulator n=1 Tax=Aeromicrobium ginsengisoli TaxID=363867 RepID=A0A5M4F9N8_9ACTN|nr:helix-turn-helix domain-containing protein [Aeromicrobium ginsengisoli]KAA1394427.1 helix-turn-helix transcriptional regulator [Aeromicrobium ginsengisoli]
MVKTGHPASDDIRPVQFDPPTPEVGDIEVLDLERMRVRGGPAEFLTPQRLDFDMLLRVDEGTATHTVDFTAYALGPGDVLWVRAGQTHQWGRIDDIDGPSVLFAAHAIDDRTRELVRTSGTAIPNVWPASLIERTPVAEAWALLLACGRQPTGDRTDVRDAALAHATGALLTQLALAQPADQTAGPAATHEAYIWFRDEIDRRFGEWHQVTHYAERLGYSPRTLNRLARAHTGRSAKQLIDERVVLEAKRLLSHGEAPVAEIAERLGFDDPSNFSAYFRARAGVTPGAFRRAG